MGGFTHSIIFEPWAPGAYAAVEANCSEHGNHNPGVEGSSPSPATSNIKDLAQLAQFGVAFCDFTRSGVSRIKGLGIAHG
jgi:hypothetical protein